MPPHLQVLSSLCILATGSFREEYDVPYCVSDCPVTPVLTLWEITRLCSGSLRLTFFLFFFSPPILKASLQPLFAHGTIPALIWCLVGITHSNYKQSATGLHFMTRWYSSFSSPGLEQMWMLRAFGASGVDITYFTLNKKVKENTRAHLKNAAALGPIVFSVADQSGSRVMITICRIPYIYTACNLEHSSVTAELPSLTVPGKWPLCKKGQ